MSWWVGRDGWLCQHPGPPAEGIWPVQRSALSHSEPQLLENRHKNVIPHADLANNNNNQIKV